MTTKIKTTLLTAFFFFGLLTGLQAQDKYDYEMIFTDPTGKLIIHKVSNTGHEKVQIQSKATDLYGQLQEILKVVHDETENGWEVINVTLTNAGNTDRFYLKKKLK